MVHFIVGGSSGIGLAVARKLVDMGDVVYCGARGKCPDERVTSLILDVTDEGSIERAADEILAAGELDTLIYSAGFSMAAPLERAEEKDYRYLFEVNYFGAISACQRVLPRFRAQKHGDIVFISSIGGILPIAFDAFYSSSKAALNSLAREMNMELRQYNIRVTAVMPGGTATNFTFKRKVYSAEAAGDYFSAMTRATLALANIEQGGMSAEKVADTVIRAVKTSRGKSVVAAGLKNKAYAAAQKILPQKLTAAIVRKKYHQ